MAKDAVALEEAAGRCQFKCMARCCRYITVQIPAPKGKRDLEELSWFLAHREVSVYVESRRWHLEFRTPCKYLTQENLCAIYDDRPDVCRDYSTDACEYPTRPEHSLQFDSRDDFEYWRAAKSKRRREQRLTAAPAKQTKQAPKG
jgi:uncharacterized protein